MHVYTTGYLYTKPSSNNYMYYGHVTTLAYIDIKHALGCLNLVIQYSKLRSIKNQPIAFA